MKTQVKLPPSMLDQPLPKELLTDGHPGYPDDKALGDTRDALMAACGATVRSFPDSLWIEPNRWKEKAAENDQFNTWPMNYVDRYTNQPPTHECTTHSLRALLEAARNRQIGVIYPDGPKHNFRYAESAQFGSVWLSPLSVYAEANPGQWGGAGIRQVMEIAVRRGMLPDNIQPREYKFKHTLHGTTGAGNSNQSRGSWVAVRNFPTGWEQTADLFKPVEIIFPESYEQAVCLVLNGIGVGVGRSGHAIPWMFWNSVSEAMGYPDSYNETRHDSKRVVQSAWRGSFGVVTVKSPHRWLDPAGTLAL